ncbi:MAG: hypothetical protein ACRD15_18860, partial [Vicinamibacterales bacterium]
LQRSASMNFARVAMAAVASWIVYLGVSFLVHAVLLRDIYMQHAAAMRPEAEAGAILPLGFGFALVGFFAFAYAYAKGYEGGGAQEGIRYGVLVGILLCCFGTIWGLHGVARFGHAGRAVDGGLSRRVRAVRADCRVDLQAGAASGAHVST